MSGRGLTAWRAVFEQISIDSLPGGMKSLKIMKDSVLVLDRVLTLPEAHHLAGLLLGYTVDSLSA